MSQGLDTALARRLHQEGDLPLSTLQAALAELRRARPSDDLSLALLLVQRGLLAPTRVEHLLRELGPDASHARPRAIPFPGYELVRELGRGGMGTVFEVRHQTTGQRYALKQLLPEAAGEGDLERFAREAQTLASLDHPGLVRIHAARLEGPTPCFVQELLSGGSLADRLRNGPLVTREARRVLRQIGDALTYLHGQGVLHRDLKPENVLFDERGRARLTDFGLARVRGGLTLTQTGEVLGTPAYMAPEQITDSRSVDERSEVYALGALLYALLTGDPPFRRAGVLATLDAVLRESPRAPQELNPAADSALAALCLRALAKEPSERPASVREFVAGLEGAPRARARYPALFLVGGVLGAASLSLALWPSASDPASSATTKTPPQTPGSSASPPAGGVAGAGAGDDAALPPPLRLPADASRWAARKGARVSFAECLPNLVAVAPELEAVVFDWALLQELYGGELEPFRMGEGGAPTREEFAQTLGAAHGGNLQGLFYCAQGHHLDSLLRALRFSALARGEPNAFDEIVNEVCWREQSVNPGPFSREETLVIAFAGLEAGVSSRMCSTYLAERARGAGIEAPWRELRRLNARVWEPAAELRPTSRLFPGAWGSAKTTQRRAFRLMTKARTEGGPEWAKLCAAAEQALGGWSHGLPLEEERRERLRARRRTLRQSEAALSPEEERELGGLELAFALRGAPSVLGVSATFRRAFPQLGQDPVQGGWCVVIALLEAEAVRAEGAGGGELGAQTFGALGKTLSWGGYGQAARGALYLATQARAGALVASALEGPEAWPQDREEAWSWVASLWRVAREIELGTKSLRDLQALRK